MKTIKKKTAPVKTKKPAPKKATVTRQATAAAKRFKAFTGHEPEVIGEMKKPVIPDVLAVVGDVIGIAYRTTRDGVTEEYYHEFTSKAAPMLCTSPDGKALFLIGGNYRFLNTGINDAV